MESSAPDGSQSIEKTARLCSDLLIEWIQTTREGSKEFEDAADATFRFNLWARTNAALDAGFESMDRRLRRAPVPHLVVTDMLRDLASRINAQKSFSNPTLASLPGERAQYDVNVVLDQLFQLSRAIRRSGITRRFARAAQFMQEDENARSLAEVFRHGVVEYLNKTSKLEAFLKERLLDTICLRQQYFAYLSSQRASRISIQGCDPFQKSAYQSVGVSPSIIRNAKPGETPSSTFLRHRGSTRRMRMGATTLATNALPAPSEYDWIGIEDLEADLPRKPKRLPGKDAECPYCYTVCSKAELADPGWAKHIIPDLMPFVCLFDECKTPLVLYKSITAWMGHMTKDHAEDAWVCMDQSHTSFLKFQSRTDMEQHLIAMHQDEIDEEDLQDVVEECYMRQSPLESLKLCPICSEVSCSNSGDLQKHIAAHMVSLSQVSLSAYVIPEDFEMEYASQDGSSLRSRSSQISTSNNQAPRLFTNDNARDELGFSQEEEFEDEVETSTNCDLNIPELVNENLDIWDSISRDTQHTHNATNDKMLARLAANNDLEKQEASAVANYFDPEEPVRLPAAPTMLGEQGGNSEHSEPQYSANTRQHSMQGEFLRTPIDQMSSENDFSLTVSLEGSEYYKYDSAQGGDAAQTKGKGLAEKEPDSISQSTYDSKQEDEVDGATTSESQAVSFLPPDIPRQPAHTSADTMRDTLGSNSEYLDRRYRVEPSLKFEPGSVSGPSSTYLYQLTLLNRDGQIFKVMWSEPKGGNIPGGGSRFSDTLQALQDHMSGVWTGFRRFIVIRNGEGHCSCIPILTYGKLGCLKNGVKPHHHGIIFERGQEPVRLPNEPALRFEPICAEMNPGEHLSEESRVNYRKLVTVEHNVKVLFVGRVLYEDWPIVQQAVDECWDAKKSHPGESSRKIHGHRSGNRKRK